MLARRKISIQVCLAMTLMVVVAALMLISLLTAPAVLAAPGAHSKAGTGSPSHQTLISASAPMTIYLPILYKIFPPVVTFYDDFSNPASGWPVTASSICNPHTNDPITKAGKPEIPVYWTRGYLNGEYQFFIPPANATAVWFCQPNAFAPWIIDSDVYTVEASIRYAEGEYNNWKLNPWWDNAGLIFGANEANTQLFMICLGTQTYTDGTRTIRWNVHANTVYPYKFWDAPDKPYAFPYRGCSEDLIRVTSWRDYPLANTGYNHLMAAVNGDFVKIYINGVHDPAWEYQLPGLAATTRVGLIGGDY